MLRGLFTLALLASVAAAQPPDDAVAPPPPMTLGEPPPEVVRIISPVETLTAPRFVVGGDIGPVFGGWGMWRKGTLLPPRPFAIRQPFFPVPVAEYAADIDPDHALTARVSAAYTFERMPLTVVGSWEAYHRHAESLLLGYDPLAAASLDRWNAFNRDHRGADVKDGTFLAVGTGQAVGSGDERVYPQVQMRNVPSDAHRLRSRVAVNLADVTLEYKVWTPREEQRLEYRLLGGARYGGFFADDRAVGTGYEQSASNWFDGYGPQGGLRLDYRLPVTTGVIWLDARGGALFGRATQRFRELDRIWGGDTPYRELVQTADRTVPFLATELGVGGERRGIRLAVGVRYSQYWGIGNVGASRLDFAAVGGFLRFEVGF